MMASMGRVDASMGRHDVSCWHLATFCCDASIRSVLEAQRTFRGRRERTDVTRLTHSVIGGPFCRDAQ
jgi:hypothetical protein